MLIVERAILKYQLREAANTKPVETVSKLRKPLNPKVKKVGAINPNTPTKTTPSNSPQALPKVESMVMRGILMESRKRPAAGEGLMSFYNQGKIVVDPRGAERLTDKMVDGKFTRKGLKRAISQIKRFMHSDSAVMRGSLRESELAGRIKKAGVDAYGRATKGNITSSVAGRVGGTILRKAAGAAESKALGSMQGKLKSKIADAPMVGAAKQAVQTGKVAPANNNKVASGSRYASLLGAE